MLRILPGKSGCFVSVEEQNGRAVVIKRTNKDEYKARLAAQREKQQRFKSQLPEIVVPQVRGFDDSSFSMDCLSMLNAIDFIEIAQGPDLKARLKHLIDFLDAEFSASTEALVENNVLLRKLIAIRSSVGPDICTRFYEEFFSILSLEMKGKHMVPMGECHGDLTLSNVMFSLTKFEIGLIDFLDVFLESPLLDLVKLRQDSRFFWSSYVCDQDHDVTKYKIIMKYLDGLLNERFGEYIRRPIFKWLEMLNYLRIAPYVSSEEEHRVLVTALTKIKGDILCN
jgi:hypothetical protein